MDDSEDKQWAHRYILDPLTAPEPHQETGPGTSLLGPLRRSLSQRSQQPTAFNRRNDYPTPPTSASPVRTSFHPSNPFADNSQRSPTSPQIPPADRVPPLRRSSSIQSSGSIETRSPPNAFFNRNRTLSSPRPPPPFQPQGSGLGRSASVNYGSTTQDKGKGLQRSGSLRARHAGDMSHRPLDMIRREQRAADRAPHMRVRHQYPITDTIDSLDTTGLGGSYHHGGPYDATLASRNTNKLYSPVEAVMESNLEALKATPREFVQDSLTKHVPLQGVAILPPGSEDMNGNVMKYREGADLMREPDAAGGAYRRYDFIPYRDNDLKGKGESDYTLDKPANATNGTASTPQATSSGAVGPSEYDMQPRSPPSRKSGGVTIMARQRSVSDSIPEGAVPVTAQPTSPTAGTDLRRRNTTGKRIADGIMRRFGSLRRKKPAEATA